MAWSFVEYWKQLPLKKAALYIKSEVIRQCFCRNLQSTKGKTVQKLTRTLISGESEFAIMTPLSVVIRTPSLAHLSNASAILSIYYVNYVASPHVPAVRERALHVQGTMCRPYKIDNSFGTIRKKKKNLLPPQILGHVDEMSSYDRSFHSLDNYQSCSRSTLVMCIRFSFLDQRISSCFLDPSSPWQPFQLHVSPFYLRQGTHSTLYGWTTGDIHSWLTCQKETEKRLYANSYVTIYIYNYKHLTFKNNIIWSSSKAIVVVSFCVGKELVLSNSLHGA